MAAVSRFLSLPREVRNLIYEYLWCDKGHFTVTFRGTAFEINTPYWDRGLTRYRQSHRSSWPRWFILTNKQVLTEALSSLHDLSIWVEETSEYDHYFKSNSLLSPWMSRRLELFEICLKPDFELAARTGALPRGLITIGNKDGARFESWRQAPFKMDLVRLRFLEIKLIFEEDEYFGYEPSRAQYVFDFTRLTLLAAPSLKKITVCVNEEFDTTVHPVLLASCGEELARVCKMMLGGSVYREEWEETEFSTRTYTIVKYS